MPHVTLLKHRVLLHCHWDATHIYLQEDSHLMRSSKLAVPSSVVCRQVVKHLSKVA